MGRILARWPARSSGRINPGRRSLARDWEQEFAFQIKVARLPAPQRQYPFAKPERAFMADFAWPAVWLLVEIDGAVHRIADRFAGDFERDQWIFFSRWRKLRISPSQVRSGEGIRLLERALSSRPPT